MNKTRKIGHKTRTETKQNKITVNPSALGEINSSSSYKTLAVLITLRRQTNNHNQIRKLCFNVYANTVNNIIL